MWKIRKSGRILGKHPQVSWVNYAGLPNNKYYAVAKRIVVSGKPSAILSFGIKGGLEAGANLSTRWI